MDDLRKSSREDCSMPSINTSSESKRMSRRDVLSRIGFKAAAAAVAALTSEELLRKVGAEMQRRGGDSQVARSVAREFVAAGVAFAHPPSAPPPANCIGSTVGAWCFQYHKPKAECKNCCDGVYNNYCKEENLGDAPRSGCRQWCEQYGT